MFRLATICLATTLTMNAGPLGASDASSAIRVQASNGMPSRDREETASRAAQAAATQVPEPGTVALFFIGVMLVAQRRLFRSGPG